MSAIEQLAWALCIGGLGFCGWQLNSAARELASLIQLGRRAEAYRHELAQAYADWDAQRKDWVEQRERLRVEVDALKEEYEKSMAMVMAYSQTYTQTLT